MKQRITLDHILSLKPEALDRLEKWVEPKGYTLLLTIGQMIDFLSEQDELDHGWYIKNDDSGVIDISWSEDELRDALWRSCKHILERKEAAA